MAGSAEQSIGGVSRPASASASSGLPHTVVLLCVSAREPAWANLTLQLDAAGCMEPTFRWASSSVQALSLMRDETFDCLIVAESGRNAGLPPSLDGFELLRAARTGGHDEPVVLLTPRMDDDRWIASLELDCRVLTTPHTWESRALVPTILNEIQRSELKRDNHRLSLANHRRLLRERDETEQLLDQQRQILQELQELVEHHPDRPADDDNAGSGPVSDNAPPRLLESEEVQGFYDELLRTYVMMGSGRLAEEIERLARLLAAAGIAPRKALGMHIKRVEKLVRGLGRRSSRHVMSRADILGLELAINLGECYRDAGGRQCISTTSLGGDLSSE